MTCGPLVGVGVTEGELRVEMRLAELRMQSDAQAALEYYKAEARTAIVTAGAREIEQANVSITNAWLSFRRTTGYRNCDVGRSSQRCSRL